MTAPLLRRLQYPGPQYLAGRSIGSEIWRGRSVPGPADTAVPLQPGETQMAIRMVSCSVLGAKVPCLMELGGDTTSVMCTARDRSTGLCRMKNGPFLSEGGPLSQFLASLNEPDPSLKAHTCHLLEQ